MQSASRRPRLTTARFEYSMELGNGVEIEGGGLTATAERKKEAMSVCIGIGMSDVYNCLMYLTIGYMKKHAPTG